MPWQNVNESFKCVLILYVGVGRVGNIRFDQLFTAVMWDPPLTAGTLDSLYYHVIVVNNDTGVVIVSNTTMVTTQPLPDVQRCQYYTANVTAFSSDYYGDSVVTGGRSPGSVCVCACALVQVFVHKIILVCHSFRILPCELHNTKCCICYVIQCHVFY